MRKYNSLKKFEKFSIDKKEMQHQKGGVFCEIYIGYASSQNIAIDPNVMSVAEDLDETLATQGWWAALQQAGGFLSNYR